MKEFPKGWRMDAARSGDPTAWIGERLLHSRFDPVREAGRVAAEVPSDTSIVVLAGFGLGYVAEALWAERPGRPLVIAEADPILFRTAMDVRNLSGLLEQPAVTVLAGGDPDRVRDCLNTGPTGGTIHMVHWQPSEALHPKWYRQLENAVRLSASRRIINERTLERFGRLWVRNLAANAPILEKALSISPWRDCMKDIPALVLAGGPSLDEILPFLPRLRERALLIVVDTALGAVLRIGIEPDVAAAVDPQYWNSRHLDRCRTDALVLAEPAAHPAVFRTLSGRPWLSRSNFPLGTLLENASGLTGTLKAGGSVATAAWSLAAHLGCRPLFIAGLDLGFPGRRSHHAGSLPSERPHFLAGRLQPAQTAFWSALADAGPYRTPASGGGMVLTDRRMDVYAAWFTENAAIIKEQSPRRIGSLGRAVEGLPVTEPETLLALPKRRKKIEALLTAIRESPPYPQAHHRIREALKKAADAMEGLITLAEQGWTTAGKLRKALARNADPAAYLAELDKIDSRLLNSTGREVVSFLMQPLLKKIETASDGSPLQSLENSEQLYKTLADSAGYHRLFIIRAYQRFLMQ